MITFDEICTLEPELRRLHNMAKMIGRRRGKSFCANRIWYDLLKPRLVTLVGWGRVASLPESLEDCYTFMDRDDIMNLPDPPKRSDMLQVMNMASDSTDSRLWTPEAYELAYETIYSALPDCRGCTCS